jgi:hypothetical protein
MAALHDRLLALEKLADGNEVVVKLTEAVDDLQSQLTVRLP